MRTEIITSTEEFAALQPEWDALFERTPPPNFFRSHGWLHAWWETFGGDRELCIVVVRREPGGAIAAILPVFRETAGGLHPGRTVRLLGSQYVSSDFLGLLLDPEAREEATGALLRFLRSDEAGWDVLELDGLEGGGELATWVERSFGADAQEHYVCTPLEACPYITLPEDWDTLLAGLSRKWRERIRYSRRLLERRGAVEVERVASTEGIDGVMNDLLRLRLGWMKNRGYRPLYPPETYARFHSRVWERLMAKGQVKFRFLRYDGERVAFAYLFRDGKTTYYYQTGYDDAYAPHSVGSVLLGYIIEEAVVAGSTHFEFLRGDEAYKYRWGETGTRELVRVKIYNATGAGRLRYALDSAVKKTRSLARELRVKQG